MLVHLLVLKIIFVYSKNKVVSMKNLNSIWFWLKAARVHTLPMSFMSWLIPFSISLKSGGNILYGILALIGVMSAHLGVNLIDDYFDYKREVRTIKSSDEKKSIKMQKGKCAYLINGQTTLDKVLLVICIYFGLASLIGLFFLFVCSWKILLIAAMAGLLCILYPFLTYWGLSEFAVGMTFAPLLFTGVSYVMLGYCPIEILILSISTGCLTIGLLHTHALMDYDCDIKDNKKTLCILTGSKHNALIFLGIIMSVAYVNIAVGVILNIFPKPYLLTFLTMPLPIVLYYFMNLGIKYPEIIPERKWWMGPMENWNEIIANNAQNFMLKFYISRNIMVFFTITLCIGILFS